MDFKLPENILEFLHFQRNILRKYKNYIKSKMQNDYKKAAVLVYWLNDYIEYIKSEKTFNPSMNITYKRGQIVFVNFGYRIGTELGGDHYAIVLDVKNSKQSKSITVLPLKSNKKKSTAYSKIYYFPLGNKIKYLLENKAYSILDANLSEALLLARQLNLAKQADPQMNPKTMPEVQKVAARLKRNRRIADSILAYAKKLNNESIADMGQIITISKQRIKHPCKPHDVLTGVILDEETLNSISGELKKFYVGI